MSLSQESPGILWAAGTMGRCILQVSVAVAIGVGVGVGVGIAIGVGIGLARPGPTLSGVLAGGCTRRRAFTLVELLVVIAILAILAGLLLPGFPARGRGPKPPACLSNLRQIGVAQNMYVADFQCLSGLVRPSRSTP